MSLKITLKPNEKVIIGGAVITNGHATCHLNVENNVPILRKTDIMSDHNADTPCKRLYLAIQLIYIDEKRSSEIHPIYWELVKDLLEAAPSMKDLISQISQSMLDGRYYQALKLTKKLIAYEEELLHYESKLS